MNEKVKRFLLGVVGGIFLLLVLEEVTEDDMKWVLHFGEMVLVAVVSGWLLKRFKDRGDAGGDCGCKD